VYVSSAPILEDLEIPNAASCFSAISVALRMSIADAVADLALPFTFSRESESSRLLVLSAILIFIFGFLFLVCIGGFIPFDVQTLIHLLQDEKKKIRECENKS
jgi:hypothetical protein